MPRKVLCQTLKVFLGRKLCLTKYSATDELSFEVGSLLLNEIILTISVIENDAVRQLPNNKIPVTFVMRSRFLARVTLLFVCLT